MKRYSQILFYSVVALWGFVLLELIVRYPCNHGPDSRDMIPWFCVTFLLSLPLLLRQTKISLLCLFLSLGGVAAMVAGDAFNVMVPYDTWTERGMPEMFTLASRAWSPAIDECSDCSSVHVRVEPRGFVALNGSVYALAEEGVWEGRGVLPPSSLADLLENGSYRGKAFSFDSTSNATGSDIMRALRFFRDHGMSNLDYKLNSAPRRYVVERFAQGKMTAVSLTPSENANDLLAACVQRIRDSRSAASAAGNVKELVRSLSRFADAGLLGVSLLEMEKDYCGPLTVKDVETILGEPVSRLFGDRVLVHQVNPCPGVCHSILTCYDGYILIGAACITGDKHLFSEAGLLGDKSP